MVMATIIGQAANWTPAALAAAVGVLVVAICTNAVVLARTYVHVANIIHGLGRAGVPVRGMGAGSSPAIANPRRAAPPVDGAGTVLPSPAWSQLTDVSISPRPAAASVVDCGPEAVAIVVDALTGVPVPAEYLRYLWFGLLDSRLTGSTDLVGMLRLCGVPAHAVSSAYPQVCAELQRAAAITEYSIVLGTWLTPNLGHWVVICGATPTGVTVRDPWHGTEYGIDWSTFKDKYSNCYVHIDRAHQAGT